MKKTRTEKIEETFCDLCGEQIEEHFDQELGKCADCGREICPRCIGYYEATVTKFRGHSGTTVPDLKLSRSLCLECGIKYEVKLLELGLTLKQPPGLPKRKPGIMS